jgi:hypothetical protein
VAKPEPLIQQFHDARRTRRDTASPPGSDVSIALRSDHRSDAVAEAWAAGESLLSPFRPLPVQAIVANPHSERGPVYGPDAPAVEVAETVRLAESIARRGLWHPIGVKPIAGARWQVVYGDRRLAAHIHLRRPTVMSLVLDIPDVSEQLTCTIVENLTHRSLKPRQRSAELWRLAAARFGVTDGGEVTRAQVDDLAQVIGVAPRTVWRTLAILRTSEKPVDATPATTLDPRVRRAVRSTCAALAEQRASVSGLSPDARGVLGQEMSRLRGVADDILAALAAIGA